MKKPFIYESPDGGATIYARRLGEKNRILIPNSGKKLSSEFLNNLSEEEIEENEFWYRIRKAGKSNAAIQNALDRVIILYKLSLEYEDV